VICKKDLLLQQHPTGLQRIQATYGEYVIPAEVSKQKSDVPDKGAQIYRTPNDPVETSINNAAIRAKEPKGSTQRVFCVQLQCHPGALYEFWYL